MHTDAPTLIVTLCAALIAAVGSLFAAVYASSAHTQAREANDSVNHRDTEADPPEDRIVDVVRATAGKVDQLVRDVGLIKGRLIANEAVTEELTDIVTRPGHTQGHIHRTKETRTS